MISLSQMIELVPTFPLSATTVVSAYLVCINLFLNLGLSWTAANCFSFALGGLILFQRLRRKPVPQLPVKRWEVLFLALCTLAVLSYALSWFWLKVPPDFWIDFPQQALFRKHGLDLTHPFIPHITLGGQYGRNLLVAGVAQATRLEPVSALIWSTLLSQALLLYLVYFLFRNQSPKDAAYTVLIVFFGLGVGAWAGLVDHFFHHASLAHLFLFAAWQLLRDRDWQATIVLLALGLVYPLYLVFVVIPWLWAYRRERRMASFIVIGMTLAVFQGGPLTQLLKTGEKIPEWQASQQQRFTVGFPKKNIFQIYLQPWSYWRRSVGLNALPGINPAPAYQKPLYSFIFGWKVLQLQWLPLWLLPFSFKGAAAEQKRWLTMAILAFITPGLIDLGPVYETEYYRWELAAAVAAGVVLASSLSRRKYGWIFVILCCWPGMVKFHEMSWDIRLPSQTTWLQHHATALRMRKGELEIIQSLAALADPSDIVWRDSLPDFDDNKSMNGDATIVGLSGLQMSGKALPLPDDFIGRPPFRPSLNAKAFWKFGDPAAVSEERVRWLVTDNLSDYSEAAEPVEECGQVKLWKVRNMVLPKQARSTQNKPPAPLVITAGEMERRFDVPESYQGAQTYYWRSTDGEPWTSQPIHQSGDGLMVSAPELPGSYELVFSSGVSLPATVEPRSTLRQLHVAGAEWTPGSMMVQLRNSSKYELRIHNAYLAVLEMDAAGRYGSADRHGFFEVFTIGPESKVQLAVPYSGGKMPDRGSLYIECREGSRPIPLR